MVDIVSTYPILEAMPRKRDDRRADAMDRLYKRGFSLAEVGAAFGVTRQSVFKMFKLRGIRLRPRPRPLPFIVFRGRKYTLRKNGYYGRTNGKREYLHRDVWRVARGKIPKGHDVHHRDEDRANNSPRNLELLPKAEHARRHAASKHR